MEYLCDFAIENIELYTDKNVIAEDYSYDEFADIDSCVDIISRKLLIDKKDITVKDENIDIQRATVISFKLNGRICEFYEILGTQRDYLGVRLVAMVWKTSQKSQINFGF